MPTCLYVEDQDIYYETCSVRLKRAGFDNVLFAADVNEAKSVIETKGREIDLMVIDMKLGYENFGGYAVLKHARDNVSPHCMYVIYTAHGYVFETKQAIEAVSSKFIAFVEKEDLEALEERAREAADQAKKRSELAEAGDFAIVASRSKVLYEDIERYIAPSLLPVLIIGPTGTGKEHTAAAIHDHSGLPKSAFRPINCAAFSTSLIMSELFGHVKGAFTGADNHRIGLLLEASGLRQGDVDELVGDEDKLLIERALMKFEGNQFYEISTEELEKKKKLLTDIESLMRRLARVSTSKEYLLWIKRCGNNWIENETQRTIDFPDAKGGTLFLDEIADLDLEAQGALLRFLDGKGIRPIGYSGLPLRPTNVRIVAATNKVHKLLNGNSFREDLFWRLAQGWIIERPPLSDPERMPEALKAATLRAFNTNKERYGGMSFNLDESAIDFLSEQLGNQMFSSDKNPLHSGNFRSLLGLVDKACWIALADHPDANVITNKDLTRAERVLELLDPKTQTAGAVVASGRENASDAIWQSSSRKLVTNGEAIQFRGIEGDFFDFLVKASKRQASIGEIMTVYTSRGKSKSDEATIITRYVNRINKKLKGSALHLQTMSGDRGTRTTTVILQSSTPIEIKP